ncbi:MAG: nuclear transport factor 2 family protein [Sphingobium sp.]
MSDRDEIEEVLHAYATHLDKKTPAALADEVFTHDAVIDLGYGVWEGPERFVKEYSWELEQFDGTAHVLTNFRCQIDGDTASSSIYVTAWHWSKGSAEKERFPTSDFVTIGVYLDKLRRDPQGWRIAHRRFRRLGPSALAIGAMPDFIDV